MPETYGDDFDPVAQFDEIHPNDFTWHNDGLIVVYDGNCVRELRTWAKYDDANSDRIRNVNSDMVKQTLDNPVSQFWKTYRRSEKHVGVTQKLCTRLSEYLVAVEEVDKPSF